MLAMAIVFGFVAGLLIREILMDGENILNWFKAFIATNGTIIGGLWTSYKRKAVEKEVECKEPLPEKEKPPEPLKMINIDRFY
jgi:hypothetical protein